MPCWLLLLNDAGFPLFSRSYGLPSSAFSFATMGLLSALHSSASDNSFSVRRLRTHDAHILYQTHPGGLLLVLATSDTHCSPRRLELRLDAMYDSLVMIIGRPKLQDLRNVERTKRQIRSAASLLSLHLVEDTHLLSMGTGLAESMIPSNPRLFDHVLSLATACGTKHAALYATHRLYAFTPAWAGLDGRDLCTLSALARSLPPAQARDLPVYLAHSTLSGPASAQTQAQAGRTPYRLLSILLLPEVELLLLVGPTPTISGAMEAVRACVAGSNSVTAAAAAASAAEAVASPTPRRKLSSSSAPWSMASDLSLARGDFPRHLPSSFGVDPGVLGLMFVCDDRVMVCSFLAAAPLAPAAREPSPSPRRKMSSGSLDPPPSTPLSQFAPDHALFSSSLLSDATVLSRSHALLGFYHLVWEQMQPPPPTAADSNPSVASQSSTPASTAESSPSLPPNMQRARTEPDKPSAPPDSEQPFVSDAYMLTPTRGFYACRRGRFSLYVMFSEKVPQSTHGQLSWQLLERMQALDHRL